ncbi:hypothetical protein [Ruegeria sp. HKCCD7318]|uniref:hypothetical protein n=1 Tax=Ruegeria sp. HKCCD7318 TaxID=2683014 RepID=UPI001491B0E2|nr:hypothetical protein [Ruegeria sp. HKCCD7318]NOE36211.1 hypothetical protein [Ruegeria sp. HKCCD7318]
MRFLQGTANNFKSIFTVFFFLAATHTNAQMISEGVSSDGSNGSFEAGTDFVENNGLAVRVVFVSKATGEQRTVSVEMKNTRDEAMWLALIGPEPSAIDTQGTTYKVVQVAGLSSCRYLKANEVDNCMRNAGGYLPGSVFTNLSPGASSLLNLTLEATSEPNTAEGFMSLTMNAAMSVGDQPSASGDRGLASIPISFPLIPLEAQ